MILNKNNQKGMSVIEAMTACCVLALSVIVFMTLQSQQEHRFSQLRKFDKAAYAVDLMFEDGSSLTVNSVQEMKQAWRDNCRKRGNDDEGEGEGEGTRG